MARHPDFRSCSENDSDLSHDNSVVVESVGFWCFIYKREVDNESKKGDYFVFKFFLSHCCECVKN